jgi:hypothetical protein
MANLVETGAYDAGVYQIETADPVSGGALGIANKPLINLANRTAYLKAITDQISAGTFTLTGYAKVNSQAFTGTPTAPTPALGNSSTSLATTAFVQSTVGGYLSKSVAGGSNVTLTAVEAGNALLNLTGVLTANIAVIVPTAPTGCWVVRNNTSGAFTVTVKTAAGTGIAVTQGAICELWCDGTNVNLQQTDFVSPALTGTPTAPTAAPGTNTTQIASTAFVAAGLALKANADDAALTGVPTAPTATLGDNTTQIATTAFVYAGLALKANLASPALTGNPTAPTPALGDNDTSIATTAFVQATVGGYLSKSVAGGVTVTLTAVEAGNAILNLTGALTANIAVVVPTSPTGAWIIKNSTTGAYTLTVKTAAGTGVLVTQGTTSDVWCDGTNVYLQQTDFTSPALTGVPTAPTASPGTNTTQIASTAFVAAGLALKANLASPALTGTPTAPTAAPGTNTTQVASTAFVAAGLALKADLSGPTFTGVPAAPTAAPGTNTTQIATTEFVAAGLALKADLDGAALTGTPTAPTAAPGTNTTQIASTAFVYAGLALKANLASPTFTGNPAAPTPATGDNDTSVATTAFVQATMNGYVSVSIAGGAGSTTLTAAQYGVGIINLTGAITGARTVVFPNLPGLWAVDNNTTGAYSVTLKTAAGTGVVITQGMATSIYGDGTNIYLQQTDFISPALTGTPTTPTASPGTNTTQVASTAFVAAGLALAVPRDTATGAATIPSGTTAQRPANGVGKLRFNSDLGRPEVNNGTTWGSLGGATGGGNDAVFYLNDQTVNNDYTIAATQNAMTAGPIAIANGKTVTISSGAVWTIV